MFESYVDYNQTFRPLAKQKADEYVTKIRKDYPSEHYGEPMGEPGHSGPGTGGLTAKLFWDYYDFTRDKTVLKNVVYPLLEGMSCFLSKTVVKEGEEYLAYPSASPEQCIDGIFPNYYLTKGCMFDQQMIYECYRDTQKAADILQVESDIQEVIERQISHLTPVLIGESGQIEEYREEVYYGEIGEKKHRHISQLVALMPGQTIHKDTTEWLKAAKYTLMQRGDESTGWAMAHRLNAWARIGDGEHAYVILRNLLSKGTTTNLWDIHPQFQIDGNFGGTAGIAEMLLQSHGGFIELLPAIPASWESGSFQELVARGNFVTDVRWETGLVMEVHIRSRAGETCEIRYPGIGDSGHYQIQKCQGRLSRLSSDAVRWETETGQELFINRIGGHTV